MHKSYEGETCRNVHTRVKEHQQQLKNKSDKSVMLKHIQEDHKDEQESINFGVKITGIFKDPMTRQLDEAIRIQRKDPKLLLNSKKEFHGSAIPRKVLELKKNAPEMS